MQRKNTFLDAIIVPFRTSQKIFLPTLQIIFKNTWHIRTGIYFNSFTLEYPKGKPNGDFFKNKLLRKSNTYLLQKRCFFSAFLLRNKYRILTLIHIIYFKLIFFLVYLPCCFLRRILRSAMVGKIHLSHLKFKWLTLHSKRI